MSQHSMSKIESMSRKLVVVLVYSITFLGFLKIQDIILSPNMKNLEKLLLCIVLGSVVAYVNNFNLFKAPYIKNNRK